MAETFVLVHRAWHGGWCWAPVINLLALVSLLSGEIAERELGCTPVMLLLRGI
jgi:hypothetical protein